MAKRTAPPHRAVTPTSKGVASAGQHLQKPPLPPFLGPHVSRSMNATAQAEEERRLFTPPSQAAVGGHARPRTSEQLARAQARMTGRPIEEFLDAMGDYREPVLPPELDQPDADGPDADESLADVAPSADGESFQAAVQRAVAEEMAKLARKNGHTTTNTNTSARQAPLVVTPDAQPMLAVRRVMPEDIDRLWDWIRVDPGSSEMFLGRVPPNALALYSIMESLAVTEQNGAGLIRSLYLEGMPQGGIAQHLGFGMLAPILADVKMALLHLYLAPQVRGHLAKLIAPFTELAELELPGFKLAVVPFNEAQARAFQALLGPLGFTTHMMFVR